MRLIPLSLTSTATLSFDFASTTNSFPSYSTCDPGPLVILLRTNAMPCLFGIENADFEIGADKFVRLSSDLQFGILHVALCRSC